MQRICSLALMVALSVVGSSASVSIGLRGAYFQPRDPDFRSIYGGGVMGGAEIRFGLTQSLDFWLDGGYFAKSGKLTFTEEDTELTLLPIGAGLRYRILRGKVQPYAAAGARYVLYAEKNVIGEVNAGGIGFLGQVGLAVSLSDHFGLDVSARYSFGKLKPADLECDVGGLEAGAGLVISF